MGEVTTATIATTPANTTPTTFRSISGFALPSVIHNNQRLLYVSYSETSATALCGTTGSLRTVLSVSSPSTPVAAYRNGSFAIQRKLPLPCLRENLFVHSSANFGSSILRRSRLLKLRFQDEWQCHLDSSGDSLVVLQLSASSLDLSLYIFVELLQRWLNETSQTHWWKGEEMMAAFSAWSRLLAERNHYQNSNCVCAAMQDHVLSKYVLVLPWIRFYVRKYWSSSRTHTNSLVMMPRIFHCAQLWHSWHPQCSLLRDHPAVCASKEKGMVSEPWQETVLTDCEDFRIDIRTLTMFVSFGPCSLESVSVFFPCSFGPGYIWTCQSKAAMAA